MTLFKVTLEFLGLGMLTLATMIPFGHIYHEWKSRRTVGSDQ